MYDEKRFSQFIDFVLDIEDKLHDRGLVIEPRYFQLIFKVNINDAASLLRLKFDLIDNFQSPGCHFDSNILTIGNVENSTSLCYPFDGYPKIQEMLRDDLEDLVEAGGYNVEANKVVSLKADLIMAMEMLEESREFDWEFYKNALPSLVIFHYDDSLGFLESCLAEAEEFVDSYLNGEEEYFNDATYEALSGACENWDFDELHEFAKEVGEFELLQEIKNLDKLMVLVSQIDCNYRHMHELSYEMYQDRKAEKAKALDTV
ncbi:hypothetical protein WNY63_17760 [Pseudoalteromonas neustonica]|uniref:DUF4303 domain-containing protein n=1 Tax=Pseudoalteromonas neustonica TaxID=1840331 RepID=A0ABU9U6A0_9GAMM